MRLVAATVAVCTAVLLGAATTARADTHAPSTQHVTMICASASYDVVSPAEPAKGGQVTSSTVAIVAQKLLMVTDDATGDILFQAPTGSPNPEGQNCSFDLDGVTVTIWAIVTPRGG
jgi:hypothetical protein